MTPRQAVAPIVATLIALGLTAPTPQLALTDAREMNDASALESVAQLGGGARAVTVEGERAYLALGPRLIVLDVSHPSGPVPVGESQPLPGVITELRRLHRHVIAEFGPGLAVFSAADPTHPIVGFR